MDNLGNTDIDDLINKDEKINSEKNDKRIKLIIIIVSCTLFVATVVIICLVILLTSPYDEGKDTPETNFYGCICDAGSSSTRVSVYTWPHRKSNSIPVMTEVGRNNTKSGIHTLNDDEIKRDMEFLINFCKNKINEVSKNKSNISEANFYLKATAGMRSISVEEQNKKLNIIRKTIRESEFKFLKDDWAKVMNGSEEALFGWITGNYLYRILFENEKAGKIGKKPYGSIDLGGYSLEIAFYTSEEIKEHKINLNLNNINYNLYSYSFENYGQDRFYEALLHHIIDSQKEENSSIIIKHPCYLNGYKTSYLYKEKNYTIEGENNFDKCQEEIKRIMNINEEKDKSMNNTYQPSIPEDTMFYGISALYWISDFFKLTDDKFHAPNEFLTVAKEYCQKNWEDVVKEYIKEDEFRLKNYCISGIYIYYFLSKGFKLNENKKLIMFPDKINGVEMSWTLGAMSYEVGVQPLKNAKYYKDY